jgi:hypothetical protein
VSHPNETPPTLLAIESLEGFDLQGRVHGDVGALDDFARELDERTAGSLRGGTASGLLPRRINAEPASVEKDLAKLVLALVDLVRQVVERQAVRRVNAGSLTDEEIERMGETFLRLDQRMAELKTAFRLQDEDLNLTLGPIGNLM